MPDIILDATKADWDRDIFPKVKLAWTELSKERQLFKINVGERSLTHRLALHLEPLFPLWDIDCEYNRVGVDGDPKKIMALRQKIGYSGYDCSPEDADCEAEAITVFPDISIHRRGKSNLSDNLLIIEVKKSSGKDKEKDKIKLEAYVSSPNNQIFQYKYGLYFEIDMSLKTVKDSILFVNENDAQKIPSVLWL